jgi:hypothetical protein
MKSARKRPTAAKLPKLARLDHQKRGQFSAHG